LAQKPDRRGAMAEHLVVEFLKREFCALLLAIILAQLENLQLAYRIVEILRIEGPTDGLLPRRLLFVITVFLKEFSGLIHSHTLAMHFNGNAKAADPQQGFVCLGQAVFGSSQ